MNASPYFMMNNRRFMEQIYKTLALFVKPISVSGSQTAVNR
ncbi:hypothetical protein GGU45_002339 [Niabella hirudinis]